MSNYSYLELGKVMLTLAKNYPSLTLLACKMLTLLLYIFYKSRVIAKFSE